MLEYVEEIQSWWQDLTPQVQSGIQIGCVLLVALLGGHVLGVIVTRALRKKNFDAALRLPGAGPSPGALPPPSAIPGHPTSPEEHGITPTFLAGWLVRLSVWAAAVRWVVSQQGNAQLADKISMVLSRTWALTAVLVAALGVGSMLARRLVDWLDGPRTEAFARHGSPQRSAAGAVGAAVYVLVFLLVLLIAADVFDWPLTRGSAQALWQLAHHLLIAAAALAIGLLGARWARDMVTETAASPEKRAGQYTALGILAATTVLAIAVLLSSFGVLIGLAALAILGLLLFLARGYLPDFIAGLQLRTNQVREVWFEGVAWQVTDVGFLSTQVSRNGEHCRVQNRIVLEARLHGAPAEARADH